MSTEDRRGMGRGLAAILPRGQAGADGLREIPVELVGPNPRQPRRSIDEGALGELAESIRARGVLQPIVVRALPGGRYELLAGERRLRAARIAELESVPALVREADERDQLDIALAENMARVDLNPVDEARACATLVEDLGLTKEEVGRRVGRSRVAISNLIRLLDLPEEALELIERGELSEGHGRAMLLCKDHSVRRALALEARDGAWSVRETERRAREAETGQGGEEQRRSRGPRAVIHPDLEEALAAAGDALSAALGREVRVRARGEGCRVEIDFDTPAEAIQLAERILGKGGQGPPLQSPRRAISSVG
ncbi:MAG TPA: ParB/RepB/Spo0J family partition protein [Thermoleophilaceae bacterium]